MSNLIGPSGKQYVNNVDYRMIIESDPSETIPIRILTGPYENMEIRYGTLNFIEKDGEHVLQFDFQILKGDQTLENEPLFKQAVGDILYAIIKNSLEILEENEKNQKEHGKSDNRKTDIKGVVNE